MLEKKPIGKNMFAKLRKNRTYGYTPRFYDPEKGKNPDGSERKKFKFHRTAAPKRSKWKMFLVAVVFLFTVFFLQYLSELAKQ